jgi:2-iminobutanoate/2-iminopropanoate deaminase
MRRSNTVYVAGQQGPDAQGKATGTDITLQTTNAIAGVKKVIEHAGFKMTDVVAVTVYVTDLNDVKKMNGVYVKLMPDPKPARATVQVAGLIGGAKSKCPPSQSSTNGFSNATTLVVILSERVSEADEL